MAPDLVLYSDWSGGIVLDDVVFKRVWSTSLIAVSIGTIHAITLKKKKKTPFESVASGDSEVIVDF